MSSQILTVTIQAAFLGALSNAIAQGITAFQHQVRNVPRLAKKFGYIGSDADKKQRLSLINPTVFLHFVLIALLTTPPNYLWQRFLEDTFPGKGRPEKEKSCGENASSGGLRVVNTAAKFFLDQSIGAFVNTVIFLVVMGMFKGMRSADIMLTIRHVSL